MNIAPIDPAFLTEAPMEYVDKQHITKTPGVCGGRACIAGHRIRVQDIVVLHEMRKLSPQEIVAEYPDDVREILVPVAQVDSKIEAVGVAILFGRRDPTARLKRIQ